MTTFYLNYGKTQIGVEIPEQKILNVIRPNPSHGKRDKEEEIKRAIMNPISASLEEIVTPQSSIALLPSDITRPCPSYNIIPILLRELNSIGIKDERVKIVFTNGLHRRNTRDEKIMLLGKKIVEKIKCIDHDAKQKQKYIGDTSHHTPVYINSDVLDCDIKIGIANIDTHIVAGYSGGAKSILPGVSGVETIMKNHYMIYEYFDRTRSGILEGNPIREDMEEAAKLAGLDYIVNVVLDDKKKIVIAVAGDPMRAYRRGVETCDRIYKVPIREKADIVVASAGGFPKDINLYQATKAMDNSTFAIKNGGTIVLFAECPEGVGSEELDKLLNSKSWEEVIQKGKDGGSYAPYGFRAVAKMGIKVVLISSISIEKTARTPIIGARGAKEAIEKAIQIEGEGATITVMPFAGSTLPTYDA